ncbi:MAG: DapH/DapD/GlmU-related protein [Promethearchaeota archaeon]|jgi:UDP-3-O-[3-hydroxymyristoyl] glucosamine N-acyltransferase
MMNIITENGWKNNGNIGNSIQTHLNLTVMNKHLVIFGNQINLAPVIYEQATLLGYDAEIVLFEHEHAENRFDHDGWHIISFRNYELRKRLVAFLGGFRTIPESIINPSSYIAPSARIEDGTYIGANASISTDVKIGKHCIINLNASIGHNVVIDDHCIIAPGARISGYVHIGEGSFIGSNSFIKDNIEIGSESVIEAMTYVKDNVGYNRYVSSKYTTKQMFKPL